MADLRFEKVNIVIREASSSVFVPQSSSSQGEALWVEQGSSTQRVYKKKWGEFDPVYMAWL